MPDARCPMPDARLMSFLLDLIFPPFCASCRQKGFWWCPECRSKVEKLKYDPCARCLGDHRQKRASICTGSLPFSGIVSVGYYHNPQLRAFITSLKYDGVTAGADDLEVFLRSALHDRTEALPWEKEVHIALVPMPLAGARERERGFNQSEWIAERIKRAWIPDAEIVHALARVSSSVAQATIDDHELRKANVRGGFVCIAGAPDAVILIDDVMTTGATCREAARILLESGAKRVYVCTLALGR